MQGASSQNAIQKFMFFLKSYFFPSNRTALGSSSHRWKCTCSIESHFLLSFTNFLVRFLYILAGWVGWLLAAATCHHNRRTITTGVKHTNSKRERESGEKRALVVQRRCWFLQQGINSTRWLACEPLKSAKVIPRRNQSIRTSGCWRPELQFRYIWTDIDRLFWGWFFDRMSLGPDIGVVLNVFLMNVGKRIALSWTCKVIDPCLTLIPMNNDQFLLERSLRR